MSETNIKSKGDVVDEVAALVDLPQTKVDAVLKAFVETIKRQVASGGEVRMVGFGSFKVTHRAARTSRNPQNGEPIEVGAHNAIRFVPGQALKDAAASSFQEAAPKAKSVKAKKAPDETANLVQAEAKKEKKPKKKKS